MIRKSVLLVFAAALFMLLLPALALAQGPPEGCTPWTVDIDFEDGSTHGLDDGFTTVLCPACAGMAPAMNGTYWLEGGSSTYPTTGDWTLDEIHSYFGTWLTSTIYFIESVQFVGNTNAGPDREWHITLDNTDALVQTEWFTGSLANTQYTWTMTPTLVYTLDTEGIQFGRVLADEHSAMDDFIITGCATGYFPEGAASGEFCALVDNADFEEGGTVWDLYNSASISNSLLSLAGVDYAEQAVDIDTETDYTVALTATGTTTDTDILQIEIVGIGDLITRTFELTATAAPYSATFTTGISPTTPTLRLLMASGSGDIDFICLTANMFSGEYGECLTNIIAGGEFEDAAAAANWIFVNGAAHNEVAQNAWLPYIMSGTIQNLGTSAIGKGSLEGTPPELATGEYLILQFDARSLIGDGVIVAGYVNNALTNTVNVTYTFSASTDYQTYQTDFSLFAGDTSDIQIGFYNGSYVVTETAGLFLDNVCLFVSRSPITNPTDTGGYLNINLPNCATVSSWLSDTIGIDFESLETMEDPSIWDPEDWVPWLASRLWVYAIKPLICFLLILVNLFGLAFLNWLWWVVRQPDLILAWVGGLIGYFVADLAGWLAWFISPLASLFSFLFAILGDWQIMLTYIDAILSWLLDLLAAIFLWVLGYWLDQFIGVINLLLAAWNLLVPGLGAVIGALVDVGIGIWNNLLVPWLEDMGAVGQFILFLVSQIGVLGDLIGFFFDTIWYFVTMIWGFITGAADLPIAFYQEFNNSINDDAYILLSCDGDVTNYWCLGLAGLVIVDEAIAHSFLYPLVIIGIILATIVIFWRHIWELISFRIR